ncbi:MAG: hypothetical protein M3014_11445 [Chloroflexota bacterium]|nr:hypothetical protein [Chloroflexota bacterium]
MWNNEHGAQRGSPLYIRTGQQIISLVPEAMWHEIRVLDFSVRLVRPTAIYVIDDVGVTRLEAGIDRTTRWLLMALTLVGPGSYLLLFIVRRWLKDG